MTATVTGTISAPAPAGTVTFYSGKALLGTGTLSGGSATLKTTLPGGANSISIGYGGDSNYNPVRSPVVTVMVGQTAPTATLKSSAATIAYGGSVTLTATVTGGSTVPTGAVVFEGESIALGRSTLTNGVATLTTTALPVGTDSITASYEGDSNYAAATSLTITITVTRQTPAVTVKSCFSTVPFGTSVTLTATVPAGSGPEAPTGTVTFINGSTTLGGGTLSDGAVALTIAQLPVGNDNITVKYNGDWNYTTATSAPATVTVAKQLPVMTVRPSVRSATYGACVMLTATLRSAAGAAAPTGTVTFQAGSKALGKVTLTGSGEATLATAELPAGADSVTASYGGDTNYAAATSSAATLAVSTSTPAVKLAASPSSVAYGTMATLTAAVAGAPDAAPPTGTVTFKSGLTTLGTGTVTSGMATLTTAALLETSRTSAMFGTGVTLTATLTGAAQPAGTVTFLAGAKTLGTGTLDTNAVATLATAELPAGAHRIAIRYGGDTNYTAAKSSIAAVTVTQATPAVTLKSSVASTTFGAGVTLTAAVTGPAEAAVPTGTVTFKTGSTTLGTGTVTGGVATLTTAALPVGLDSLTATQTTRWHHRRLSARV